jgi:hypothetical protein
MAAGLGPARKRILRQRKRMLFGFVISPRASWQLGQLAVCWWLGAGWRSRAETKSMYNKFCFADIVRRPGVRRHAATNRAG